MRATSGSWCTGETRRAGHGSLILICRKACIRQPRRRPDLKRSAGALSGGETAGGSHGHPGRADRGTKANVLETIGLTG